MNKFIHKFTPDFSMLQFVNEDMSLLLFYHPSVPHTSRLRWHRAYTRHSWVTTWHNPKYSVMVKPLCFSITMLSSSHHKPPSRLDTAAQSQKAVNYSVVSMHLMKWMMNCLNPYLNITKLFSGKIKCVWKGVVPVNLKRLKIHVIV